MKKALKILSLVLVFALVMAPVVTFAVPDGLTDLSATTPTVLGNQGNLVGQVLGAIQWIGYAVAVVMVLWLGVQWMLAQPAKKAELKGKMWSMAIGIILLVAGVTIINAVWNIAEGAGSSISIN